jgi:2-hydroxy-6-oxonona-2,4-dienedioate hydrolase/4,5:9,10-diseco-3-hydroxy-5,9,17-trioxoandrosta-1(10),2-diene-4-oate hydrolase
MSTTLPRSTGTDRSLPTTHHRVRTTLGTIAVTEVGPVGVPHARTVVMLHGGGPGASGWSNFAQNLPELARHFRILLPDQPGFGDSYRPTESDLADRSITDITADAMLQALRQLDVDSFDLVGNSLGGAAALRLALLEPDRVGRLVLLAPGGGWLPVRGTPTEGQRAMARYHRDGPSPEGMRRFIRTMVADPRRLDPLTILSRYDASVEPTHAEFYEHYHAAFARRGGMDPLWRDLDGIVAPTLLVWGRDDRTITLDGAHVMLNQIPDVRLHVFGRCGHWVQVERQAEFDRLVVDFLGENP